MRYTYKLYNPDSKSFILTRDVKWGEWNMTNLAETLKMFCDSHEKYLVPGVEEDKNTTSEPEDKLPVSVIPDEA